MKAKLLFLLGTSCLFSIVSIGQTGYVGIGTTTPHSRLDLGSSVGITPSDSVGKKLAVYNNSSGTDFYGIGITPGLLQFHTAATPTEAPQMTVSSDGDLVIIGPNATKASGGSGTSWAVTSDGRSKTNIRPLAIGLKEILKIQPKTFQYNGRFGTPTNGEVVTGIIAQELQQILPNSIQTIKDKNGESFLQLKTTDQILFGLVNAIKEQQNQIDDLKMQNKILKANLCREEAIQAQLDLLKNNFDKYFPSSQIASNTQP